MGNGDRANTAKRLKLFDGGLVHQAGAVPQDAAVRCPQKEGSLAEGEPRLDADSGEAGSLGRHPIAVAGAELVQSGPRLPAPSDVLALVIADDAVVRWGGALGVLGATGGADVIRHE